MNMDKGIKRTTNKFKKKKDSSTSQNVQGMQTISAMFKRQQQAPSCSQSPKESNEVSVIGVPFLSEPCDKQIYSVPKRRRLSLRKTSSKPELKSEIKNEQIVDESVNLKQNDTKEKYESRYWDVLQVKEPFISEESKKGRGKVSCLSLKKKNRERLKDVKKAAGNVLDESNNRIHNSVDGEIEKRKHKSVDAEMDVSQDVVKGTTVRSEDKIKRNRGKLKDAGLLVDKDNISIDLHDEEIEKREYISSGDQKTHTVPEDVPRITVIGECVNRGNESVDPRTGTKGAFTGNTNSTLEGLVSVDANSTAFEASRTDGGGDNIPNMDVDADIVYVPYYLQNFNSIVDTVLSDSDNQQLFSEDDLQYVNIFRNLPGTCWFQSLKPEDEMSSTHSMLCWKLWP